MSNDTTRLFGLGGVEVVGVEVDADGTPMLVLVTCDEQAMLSGLWCALGLMGAKLTQPWRRTYRRSARRVGSGQARRWAERQHSTETTPQPGMSCMISAAESPHSADTSGMLRPHVFSAVSQKTRLKSCQDHTSLPSVSVRHPAVV